MESHGSISDAAKAAHERLIRAIVEQFERNTIDFLQEEYASDSPCGQEAYIGNIDDDDDDAHVPTAAKFQAMVDDRKRLNALVEQLFDERMAAQAKVVSRPDILGRELYHDIELLCRDIISPCHGQLCRDIKIINHDRKSSQPGQLCRDIELLCHNTKPLHLATPCRDGLSLNNLKFCLRKLKPCLSMHKP